MFRLDGEVGVSYGQIYVQSVPGSPGPRMHEAFAGQSSGLCGAAVPGALFLRTGLHTGAVGFTVEVHGQAPSLDPVWEDVAEVSFYPASDQSFLMQWAGEAYWELDLEEGVDYRVRYCARGMDRAREQDVGLDDEPVVDRYLLQFWPAPPEPDRIVRQSSQVGAYAHEYAREQPDFEFRVRAVMAQRRAHLTRAAAESPAGMADVAVIARDADPRTVREQVISLSSYPSALPWDWVAAFDTEHTDDDRVGYLQAFLEEIGERAFGLGTVLAALDSERDYCLAFVTPAQFEQLSQLLTGHRPGVESVRLGLWTPRMHPEQSAALRAWATANVSKFTVARGVSAARIESRDTREEAEPESLA
ncbi:hypothetical protein DFR76_1039 [Nocardia pseudobrasiliensis]|uniref:DUF695 domain-containing protein n=2 Tax=Nocardia pseudobrasiliensis TaxID=45979 RepID=A0A370I8B8_9NOCA|nr:hypothetical protein DFR76_1039 [Nocardia pseudobrasiliensis]